MIGRARFRQLLVGSYWLYADASLEHPLSVSLVGAKPALLPGISGALEVEGEIDAKGLADHQPLSGSVELDRWRPLGARYALETRSNEGRPLRLVASKQVSLREPLWSASIVRGELLEEGPVARVELRIDYRRQLRSLVWG
jgi:hypothetical protein